MKKRVKITNALIVLLLIAGVVWIASIFIHIGGEYTDNAQVAQNLVDVNARVQGFVEKINVDEFQRVKRGDTLLIIEDAEYRLHLAQAEAAVAGARAGQAATSRSVATIRNNEQVTDAGIAEVEVLLRNAEVDYNRYLALYEQNAVTRQQLDAVTTQYESLKAKVQTMRRQRHGAVLAGDEQTERLSQSEAAIDVAEAALNLARLNLGYCVVVAPCDGYTSRKLVQEGELVMPGTRLFTIVDDADRWIIANYRETQCGGMKEGDRAEIKVDAFPGVTFEGEIERVSTATGSMFSNMAPDNSTGNFVKVEQRIPVKIRFTNNNDTAKLARLSAGMNAVVTVERK